MKLHYFDQEKADESDEYLKRCIYQGYVPDTCLLVGILVMNEILQNNDPCEGCNGPRYKCHGRPKSERLL